ncbi:fimbrial protein [Aeromonas simiae]|uniref:Type 1 fimbrial protein n=1 Tax=Aeromonas simiae TaxID=218936 RepID=A0A5J6WTH8_9GAMM|nr:fimbrial protein [Aeromonas simiae]QFI54449.1 type 1 fimbrial protein [Aeromonas simiae]
MRRRYIKVAMVLGLLCQEVMSAEAELEIGGTLVADPCVLTVDTEDQTVDFGAIASKTFINHSHSVGQPFSIHLSECDLTLGNSVQLTFRGEEDSDQPGTFAIGGEVAGVAIALEDSEAQPVVPGGASLPLSLNEGDTLLRYQAYLQAQDFSKVKEGEFISTLIFELEYE